MLAVEVLRSRENQLYYMTRRVGKRMKRNQLGSSNLYVSEIGFGCMSLPVNKEDHATALIEEAINQGINFFDTADLYNFGMNEEMVGTVLKSKRDQVILATKVGNRWNEREDGWSWDPSKKYIKEAVKQSLLRLKTDYIDLYQLHGGTIEDPFEETVEAFEELKQEGLIRYYGISSIRPNVIRRFAENSSIVSVMMQYSILDRRPEEEMFSLLKEKNISVIARGPLCKGLLTDSWKEKWTDKGYLEYDRLDLEQLIKHLYSLIGEDRGLTQLALQYSLHDPAVAVAIPGASKLTQLLDNIKATKSPALTNEEINKIKVWSKENKYTVHR